MSKFCPKCGLDGDDMAAFCRGCGGDLRAMDWGGGPGGGSAPSDGGPPPPPVFSHASPTASGSLPPPAPGQPLPPLSAPGYGFGNLPPSIPTNLVWAILSTILCCLPLGIVSIVYAAQVNTYLFRGDIFHAQRSSRRARNWAIISVIVSVAGWIVYLVAVTIGDLGALSRLHS
jgi:hypothetical protein